MNDEAASGRVLKLGARDPGRADAFAQQSK
jgi:hypothetical protein